MKLLYLLPLLLLGCSPTGSSVSSDKILDLHKTVKESAIKKLCYNLKAKGTDYESIEGVYCLQYMGAGQ